MVKRTHGESGTRLYSIWKGVKTRCKNKNGKFWSIYGGRGIKICDEWNSDYTKFRDWSLLNGYSDGLSIDRIDNDGNYCPDNCRWISIGDNSKIANTRNIELESGAYSNESKRKSKETHISLYGKRIILTKGYTKLEYDSIGEASRAISLETGRCVKSVKAQMIQCLSGKCETNSGYKVNYE